MNTIQHFLFLNKRFHSFFYVHYTKSEMHLKNIYFLKKNFQDAIKVKFLFPPHYCQYHLHYKLVHFEHQFLM